MSFFAQAVGARAFVHGVLIGSTLDQRGDTELARRLVLPTGCKRSLSSSERESLTEGWNNCLEARPEDLTGEAASVGIRD